ncbi:MAG TPA: DUF4350 domain-containing protein [Micromonosporaceae bacterium]
MSAIRRFLRSWYRLVVPVLAGILLLIGTFVAHEVQAINVGNPAYLNPDSSASIGGARLAADLQAHGITVQRATSTAQAVQLAAEYPVATVFVPAPALVDPDLAAWSGTRAGSRIVVVAPDSGALAETYWPVRERRSRWSPATADADCGVPAAVAAGPAEADGVEYAAGGSTCYRGGLVDVTAFGNEVTVVGASDPFRNDRIGEVGNEKLAVGLLSGRPRVVWLDIHTLEKPPAVRVPGGVSGTYPSVSPGASPATIVLPGNGSGSGSDRGDGSGTGTGDPSSGGNSSSGAKSDPFRHILPGWIWAAIGLLVLAGIAAALAAGRRMGPPVSEPMAVSARPGETVEGRGRLYRRTGDRTAVLRILQAAAIERVRTVAHLPADASRDEIITATATYVNVSADEIEEILYGEAASGDSELLHAVACLDIVVEAAGNV